MARSRLLSGKLSRGDVFNTFYGLVPTIYIDQLHDLESTAFLLWCVSLCFSAMDSIVG